MIYLKSKKLIYVRTQKTASTSIELFLRRFLVDGDYATFDRFEETETFGEQKGYILPHSFAYQLKDKFSEWNNILSFTTVRNPWEKVVSEYLWRKNARLPDGSKPDFNIQDDVSFDDFVLSNNYAHIPMNLFYNDVYGNDIIVKRILPIEYLDETLPDTLKECGIFISEDALLHKKKSDKYNYTDFYTDNSIEKIAQIEKTTISLFGYEFGVEGAKKKILST